MTLPLPSDGLGRRLGYARCSTADQNLDLQLDALNGAQCDRIFRDHGYSGTKHHRPGLDDLLETARAGDMVVVFRLDRLGRSVQHLSTLLTCFDEQSIHFSSISEGINTATPGGRLVYHIFSAVAQFEREIIVERTLAGMDAARGRGRRIGRPPCLSHADCLTARHLLSSGMMTKPQLASMFGVSRITIERAIKRPLRTPIG